MFNVIYHLKTDFPNLEIRFFLFEDITNKGEKRNEKEFQEQINQ
jgi:hypothetical protein